MNSRFKKWVDKAEGVYKRDLGKRIELTIWVLENMKNPNTNICKIIESRMDEIITKIKKTDSIFELDPLDSIFCCITSQMARSDWLMIPSLIPCL